MAIRVNYLWKWLEKRLSGLGTTIMKHFYSINIREKSSPILCAMVLMAVIII